MAKWTVLVDLGGGEPGRFTEERETEPEVDLSQPFTQLGKVKVRTDRIVLIAPAEELQLRIGLA